MKQFAIIGLGSFGLHMLEELLPVTNEIIIIDKDKAVIERFKDLVKFAYISDAIDEMALRKIIPSEIDAAIVDLGGKVELSLMTTNYLKKMGIREIIVKAQTNEHGDILKLVGATKVVYPDREAAKRITPMLVSSLLFNFMPISENLALAEVYANENCIGKTLADANLRKLFFLNVVAIRKIEKEEFFFISDPSYVFEKDDVLLVAGNEENILRFSKEKELRAKQGLSSFFKSLFAQK